MTEREPTPPYEWEPDEETGKKYRIGTVVVAIFVLVLLALGVAFIVMQPPAPEAIFEDPRQAPPVERETPVEDVE